MKISIHRILLAGLVVLVGLSACSKDDGPVGPAPGEIVFLPTARQQALSALEPLELRVRLGDGSPVTAVFYVEGDSVATGSSYTWIADRPGLTTLRAVVLESGRSGSAEWLVDVSDEGALPTPIVTILDIVPGAVPGSVTVGWEKPPENRYDIPLREYHVGFDRSPIPFSDFGTAEVQVVEHDEDVVRHSLTVEGLEEAELYFVRVRAVDTFGREGLLSAEVDTTSTGHYELSGRVTRLAEPAPGTVPMSEVLIAVGDYKSVTDIDGFYLIDNIPDYYQQHLTVRPTGVLERNGFYWLDIPERPTENQTLDVMMMRRDPVQQRNDSGELIEVDRKLFFRQFTGYVGADGSYGINLLRHWQHYPIEVQTNELDPPSPNGIDFNGAFESAIQAWNDATGEDMLVGVDYAPTTGVYYERTISGGSLQGIVRLTDPPGDDYPLGVIPIQMEMELRVDYGNQEMCDRVIAHELGHVIQLDHMEARDLSLEPYLMRAGINLSSALVPAAEEAWAARFLRYAPMYTDIAWYVDPIPDTR